MLDQINQVNDIKKLTPSQYPVLANEIRCFLLEHVSETGGHLASNLGMVELTMALHLALDLTKDKIVFDVGHQSYTHKILTGRKEEFDTLRQFHGLSGFPKPKENPSDAFGVGHSSTSISAALGLAAARDLKGTDETVVAVIGDGALSGGMAYEALNNMAQMHKNFIVILNDNKMSISENVGGMSTYLSKIRVGQAYNELKDNVEKAILNIPKIGEGMVRTIRKSKDSLKQLLVPGMLFEEMGITYIGPIDGHNIKTLMETIHRAKKLNEPILIHVLTQKGKGYIRAERCPERFHGVDPFDLETGKPLRKKEKASYTDVFTKKMLSMAQKDSRIVAISAAMPSGTGLTKFKEEFPDRFFDVGIAEEHAVTFAAGMAAAGMRPVVAIYSTFLQRAYDQILHDVCIQKLPVVFAIDRSGIVGADGETHQGVFDISYLTNIPNMTVIAPKNRYEFSDMLEYAVNFDGPVAVKYPRGTAYAGLKEHRAVLEYGVSEMIEENELGGVAILAVGSMVEEAMKAAELLKEMDLAPTIVNVRFIKPFDKRRIDMLAKKHCLIVTIEENVQNGGFGQSIADYFCKMKIKADLLTISIPDEFVPHGSVAILRGETGIDAEHIAERILNRIKGIR